MFLQANTTELFNVRDLSLIAPELILTLCACVALVMEVVLPYRKSRWVGYFSLVGVALAGVSLLLLWQTTRASFPVVGFYGTVRIDGFAVVFKSIFLLAAALTVAISMRYLDVEGEQHGEYYALVLFATTGMMFLACGYDLIVLYISLELMAVTFYVLVSYTKRERRTNEAGMKYFLLGAFSSGVLLYGMSLLYGFSGSTLLADIGDAVAVGETTPFLTLGIVLVVIGFAFKVSAVPFHTWAPDTYEGAPTPITAFLAVSSKAAGFVALLQLILIAFAGRSDVVGPLMWVLAALTMTVGNLIALRQTNIVRLLAYSGVAQA
ncbi:MAG: NADH-quinone oxidoreductase subunit N, partial [Pyrinomonadaceae bacterium]